MYVTWRTYDTLTSRVVLCGSLRCYDATLM
jgi:hypothetical protein